MGRNGKIMAKSRQQKGICRKTAARESFSAISVYPMQIPRAFFLAMSWNNTKTINFCKVKINNTN